MIKDKADVLPTGWATSTLGEIGAWRGGSTPSKSNPDFWADADYPWVTPKDMKVGAISDSEDHLSEKALAEANINLIPSRSVLLVTRSGILSRLLPVAVTGQPVTINQDLKAITPHRGLNADYIGWFFRFAANPILQSCSKPGTTVASVNTEELKAVEIPIPPSNEQRRIVAKIEELFSELDNGVESLKAARAQLKTYRQSLLKAAFEGRLTEQWRRDNADQIVTADQLLQRIHHEREARYKRQFEEWELAVEEWCENGKKGSKPKKPTVRKETGGTDDESVADASLPEGWAKVRMASICDVVRGGSPRPAGDTRYYDGDIPFLKVADLTRGDDLYLKSYTFTIKSAGLSKTRFVEPNVLMISNSGATLGVPKICTFPTTFNDGIAAFSGLPEEYHEYLYFFLLGKTDELRAVNQGAAQPNLNTGILNEYLVPVCSYEEMEMIANSLRKKLESWKKTDQELDRIMRRANGLRQAILKHAFEGKLVPQDPEDEPASALLERIRTEQEEAPKPRGRQRKANA